MIKISKTFLENLEKLKLDLKNKFLNENENEDYFKKILLKDTYLVNESVDNCLRGGVIKELLEIKERLTKQLENDFISKNKYIKINEINEVLYTSNDETLYFGMEACFLKEESDENYNNRINYKFKEYYEQNIYKYLLFDVSNDDYISLILKNINNDIIEDYKLYYTKNMKNKSKILERFKEYSVLNGLNYLDSLMINEMLKDSKEV